LFTDGLHQAIDGNQFLQANLVHVHHHAQEQPDNRDTLPGFLEHSAAIFPAVGPANEGQQIKRLLLEFLPYHVLVFPFELTRQSENDQQQVLARLVNRQFLMKAQAKKFSGAAYAAPKGQRDEESNRH
jgi:hypothetical protein